MTRTVEQFCKFARFEPKAPRLGDRELTKRIRDVTRRQPWHDSLPAEKRVVIPGYRDLRELSQNKTELMQRNIGVGWVVYLRPGNVRMFYLHDKNYQVKTHRLLEGALADHEFFVAYLSDFPILHINHSSTSIRRRDRPTARIIISSMTPTIRTRHGIWNGIPQTASSVSRKIGSSPADSPACFKSTAKRCSRWCD
jgi:hypothetical protein